LAFEVLTFFAVLIKYVNCYDFVWAFTTSIGGVNNLLIVLHYHDLIQHFIFYGARCLNLSLMRLELVRSCWLSLPNLLIVVLLWFVIDLRYQQISAIRNEILVLAVRANALSYDRFRSWLRLIVYFHFE
jgi:hypothetical protein